MSSEGLSGAEVALRMQASGAPLQREGFVSGTLACEMPQASGGLPGAEVALRMQASGAPLRREGFVSRTQACEMTQASGTLLTSDLISGAFASWMRVVN